MPLTLWDTCEHYTVYKLNYSCVSVTALRESEMTPQQQKLGY